MNLDPSHNEIEENPKACWKIFNPLNKKKQVSHSSHPPTGEVSFGKTSWSDWNVMKFNYVLFTVNKI